jgi:hypothetical protein
MGGEVSVVGCSVLGIPGKESQKETGDQVHRRWEDQAMLGCH